MVAAATVGACGSSSHPHATQPATTTPAPSSTTYTTPDGTPLLDQLAKSECGVLFNMVAGGYPPLTIPDANQYEGTKYQQLYQAVKIWDQSPGAGFNAQYVQAACTRLGMWPQP